MKSVESIPGLVTVWTKASRLQSQSYIFVPVLLGQALAYHFTRHFDWGIFLLLHLFGFFNQLYIVYANDYADRETDRMNQTYNIFSGGSRVLSEGLLRPQQLQNAALFMVALCLLIGVTLWMAYDRILALPLTMSGLALLWAYSFQPIKLSYRGGGEFLQMTGVGLMLPLFAFYAQAGSLEGFPAGVILSLLPVQLACAMSTSLPDEPSDVSSGKRTAAVILGIKNAKIAIIALSLTSLGLLSIVLSTEFSWLSALSILLIPLLFILLHFHHLDAQPGSQGLLSFNIFSVVVVLLLQIGIIVAIFI